MRVDRLVTPARLRAIGELLLEAGILGVALWGKLREEPGLRAGFAGLARRLRSL